jgi:hypothetical protein
VKFFKPTEGIFKEETSKALLFYEKLSFLGKVFGFYENFRHFTPKASLRCKRISNVKENYITLFVL